MQANYNTSIEIFRKTSQENSNTKTTFPYTAEYGNGVIRKRDVLR